MYGSHFTRHERGAALDRVAGRFSSSGQVARGFGVLGDLGFSAMVDSETAANGEVFVWTGRWPEQPVRPGPAPVELAVAASSSELRLRRGFEHDMRASSGTRPALQGRDGGVVPFEQVVAPSFRRAWVGGVDGAVVGLFCRSDVDRDMVIAELDDVGPLVENWRALVDRAS